MPRDKFIALDYKNDKKLHILLASFNLEQSPPLWKLPHNSDLDNCFLRILSLKFTQLVYHMNRYQISSCFVSLPIMSNLIVC